MSEKLTSIYLRLEENQTTSGIADFGFKTRQQMIEQYKKHAKFEFEDAKKEFNAVMNAKDEDFIVEQYRGPYARKGLKRLEP